MIFIKSLQVSVKFLWMICSSHCVVQTGGWGPEVPHLPGPQHGEVPEGGRPTHPPRPHQVITSQVGPLVDNKFPYDDGRTRICWVNILLGTVFFKLWASLSVQSSWNLMKILPLVVPAILQHCTIYTRAEYLVQSHTGRQIKTTKRVEI